MFSCKNYCSIVLILYCTNSFSQSLIPGSPTNIIGGDEIRARDGTTCKQGTHNGPTVDLGMSSSMLNSQSQNSNRSSIEDQLYSNGNGTNQDAGVYARLIIPIGEQPARLDCTQLYNLEIERLKLELEKLKQSGSASITVN